MRAVVQRVDRASVTVEGSITGQIDKGLLVLLGVAEGDTEKDLAYIVDKVTDTLDIVPKLAEKCAGLRIFKDENDKLNLSAKDLGYSALVVSQFTLYGDCRKGKRPSFDNAAKPEIANAYYEDFVAACRAKGLPVETGVFRAHAGGAGE